MSVNLRDKLPSHFRMTQQRRGVYKVLQESTTHPTAAEVYELVRKRSPKTSLATVYNCLETLSSCDVISEIQLNKGPARYCANLDEHAHFQCTKCQSIIDVPTKSNQSTTKKLWMLPDGAQLTEATIILKGTCPDCS